MKNVYSLKKGFTMIELVFVIVILGILASIAVPKLVATKDDAAGVKAAQEMGNAITELVAFYTIHGQFEDTASNPGSYNAEKELSPAHADIKRMSPTLNEVLSRTGGDKWTNCVGISVSNNNANITVKKATTTTPSNYCKAVVNVPAIAQWIDQGSGPNNGIIVGGTSIFSSVTTRKP